MCDIILLGIINVKHIIQIKQYQINLIVPYKIKIFNLVEHMENIIKVWKICVCC